jgi:gluconate 2-dehydrogenase alpha chain
VKRKPAVDAVICGLGAAGVLVAEALTRVGLHVVALERGPMLRTSPDFQPSVMQDELRFQNRHALMVQPSTATQTFRHIAAEEALPMRQVGAWQIGLGVGGSAVHWAGQCFRFSPNEFRIRSQFEQRYGKAIFPPEMTSQDWAVTYDELEPYYDRFEKLLGVSGLAGNVKNKAIPGGNVFDGPRSDHYPNPPLERVTATRMFDAAASGLGLHPYPCPAAHASRPYTNPLGVQMGPCTYCGFCSGYGCGNYAKSSPQTSVLPVVMERSGFEVRTLCNVTRILLADGGKRATGVTYVDANGESWEQPAEMVFVCAFTMENVHLLLVSRAGTRYDPATGKGHVGRNYSFQVWGSVDLSFDVRFNPFMGAGGLGQIVDDYDCDNFDHMGTLVKAKPFVGGGYLGAFQYGIQPIQGAFPGSGQSALWGAALKRRIREDYHRTLQIQSMGANQSYRDVYLDLDPTYKDRFGRPLLRVTYDFKDNDRRMSKFLVDRCAEIGKAMGGRILGREARDGPFDSTVFQTTHNCGGAIQSATPDRGVVNKYGQMWEVSNIFVYGASQFPQNAGKNPTDTVGATTLLGLDAVTRHYVKSAGPLVRA